MAEKLADFLVRELKAPPQLVGRGVIPVAGKFVIGGEPKTNKSWVAINLLLAVAKGIPLFSGFYKNGTPVLPVTRPARVLYIEQEIGAPELQKRLRNIMADEDLTGVEFFIKSKDMTFRLDTPEGFEAIKKEVGDIGPDLVLLDPLSKFHLSQENSSQDMGAVLRVADHIVADFGCAVGYIHHTSKPNPENPRRGGDRLRGSSAIFADVDTCIIVERKSSDQTKEPVLTLELEMRCGEPLEKIYLQRLLSGKVVYLGEDYRWAGAGDQPFVKRRGGRQPFSGDV